MSLTLHNVGDRILSAKTPESLPMALSKSSISNFRPATFTALIGPNGSGKSTLLRGLAGIQQAYEGQIRFVDTPLERIKTVERARSIAYLPQNTPLYQDLRVRELVMLGRTPYLGRFAPPSFEDLSQVESAMRKSDVIDLAERRIMSLSGGEYQRAMLARMLSTGAPFLLLDEPTTSLDIAHALSVLELCRRLVAQGHSVVMALHDLELVRRYADHVLCLVGDGTGRYHAGGCSEVMIPELLQEVFRS